MQADGSSSQSSTSSSSSSSSSQFFSVGDQGLLAFTMSMVGDIDDYLWREFQGLVLCSQVLFDTGCYLCLQDHSMRFFHEGSVNNRHSFAISIVFGLRYRLLKERRYCGSKVFCSAGE